MIDAEQLRYYWKKIVKEEMAPLEPWGLRSIDLIEIVFDIYETQEPTITPLAAIENLLLLPVLVDVYRTKELPVAKQKNLEKYLLSIPGNPLDDLEKGKGLSNLVFEQHGFITMGLKRSLKSLKELETIALEKYRLEQLTGQPLNKVSELVNKI